MLKLFTKNVTLAKVESNDKTSLPPVPAERKIITSEEEAKARIAEKRKEMKVSLSNEK